MKNVKLAFSVYALTLALASNGAWAAIGQANPSCEVNDFKINYNNYLTGCTDGYATGATTTAFASEDVKWAGTFTTLGAVTGNYGTCLGCEIEGWIGDNLKMSFLKTNTTYTNNSEVWKTYPAADGTTSFTLKAKWKPTTNTITLKQTNANKNSNPTTLTRYGVKLRVGDTEISKLTTIPVNYGYSFQGYYSSPDRANQVANELMKTTSTDSYLPTGTTCSGKSQADWMTTQVNNSCAWIGSDGTVGKFAGTAAAKIGADLSLYPAWQPRKFQYQFNYDCVSTNNNGTTEKPACVNVFHSGINSPAAIVTEDAWYATTDISLPVAGDQKGFFELDKWYVTISNGKKTVNLYIDVDADGKPITYTTPLNSIITKDTWQTFEDTDIPMVTFKAVWKVIPPVKMNFYSQYGATEPFATYEMTVGLRDFMGGTLRPYVAFHEVTEDNEKTEVSSPIPEGTSPNDLNGAPENATLRGFVMMSKDATATTAYSMVDQDASALQTTIVDKTQPLLIGMRSTQNAQKWMFTVDVVNETSSGGGNGSEAAAYVQFIKDNMPTGATEVNVYGVWAENCALDTGDASCKMFMSPYGAVNYVNTCSSGYNIDGRQDAGTEPSADELINGGVFEADSEPANNK